MRNQTSALMAFALAVGVSLPLAAQTLQTSPRPSTQHLRPSPPVGRPARGPAGQAQAPAPQSPNPAAFRNRALRPRRHPVAEALNLTDDQQAKLQPIIREEMTQINAARNDTSLTQEQKQQKIDQIRQTEFPKIQAILTPEQQKKLAEMQEQARKGQGSTTASPNNAPPQK